MSMCLFVITIKSNRPISLAQVSTSALHRVKHFAETCCKIVRSSQVSVGILGVTVHYRLIKS